MSFLSRVRVGVRRGPYPTGTLANPSQGLIERLGGASYSGKTVTPETALEIPAFWRGIRILSSAVGQLPMKVYRPIRPREPGATEEVPRNSGPWKLLHDSPNPTMASDEFWSLVESHLDLWGNAFLWKQRYAEPDGRVAALRILDPSRVQVGRLDDWSLFYIVDGQEDLTFTKADILHIRGLSSDGVVGYSPVQIARQQLGADLSQNEFRGRFWENDATPGVVLIHPNKINPETVDRIKAKWDNHHKGIKNKRKTAVLGENIAIHQLSMPLEDAQFVEQQRMSNTAIAHVLDLPSYMLDGDNGGNSLTYSTVEGQSLDFLKWTLNGRLVRIQGAVTADEDIMPTTWSAEFDPGALLRTTLKESYDALAIARWMKVDEKRAKSGLPPIGGAIGNALETGMTPAAPKTEPAKPKPEPAAASRLALPTHEQVMRYRN